MSELLKVDCLCAGYGDALVLEGIGFSLEAGDSMALLGRNGMGKSTLLATLVGAARYRSGTVRFDGVNLIKTPAHRRAGLGVAWVPQQRDIFPSLTVEENLTATARHGRWNLSEVYRIFPRLKERRGNQGDQLSGGEQQMLAIGRALMLNPKLLLLDEPLEGLAPIIAEELLKVIAALTVEADMAVILVEQHASQILPLTDKALVLERGRSVFWGPSRELVDKPELLTGWLGVAAA